MILDLFRKEVEFNNIHGYNDIKDLVRRALGAEDNYNLLFIGPPASAKTLFLLGILESKKGVYFDGSNTTSRMLDVLEEKRPKIICVDELDKMSRKFQNQFLNFMESGRVKVDQMKRRYDFEIKGAKVFATSNDISRLSKPLQSRFRRLFLPRYTEEQFLDISERVLPRTKSTITRYIGAQVWEQQGDIRDVINIGKLVHKSDGPQEIEKIMNIMAKYGTEVSDDFGSEFERTIFSY
jgi:replication-associated recombination protein RarA